MVRFVRQLSDIVRWRRVHYSKHGRIIRKNWQNYREAYEQEMKK